MVNDDWAFLLSLIGIFLVAVRHVLNDKLTVTIVILGVLQDTGQSDAARGQRVGQRLQGEADLRSEAVTGGHFPGDGTHLKAGGALCQSGLARLAEPTVAQDGGSLHGVRQPSVGALNQTVANGETSAGDDLVEHSHGVPLLAGGQHVVVLLTLGELVQEDLAVATGADDGVALDPHDGEVVSVVPQDLEFCHIGLAGFTRAVDLPDLDKPAEGGSEV